MKTTKQSIAFHKRAVTDLRFHPDGDILVVGSKDRTISISNMEGKLLGSFEKHEGSISTIGLEENTVVSASNDMNMFIWDLTTGNVMSSLPIEGIVRGIDFQRNIIFCTDTSMNKECFVGRCDPREPGFESLYTPQCSATSLFRYQDLVLFSDDEGFVYQLDLRAMKVLQKKKIHAGKITSLRPSACRSFFASASKDTTAKIIDTVNFSEKKVFDCGEPVNAACIFPTNDKLVAAGGVDARDVTTTRGKGSFDAYFFDVVTQERVGSYSVHFGTINALDVHPAATHYASGGEDSSIALVRFGEDFADAPFTSFDLI